MKMSKKIKGKTRGYYCCSVVLQQLSIKSRFKAREFGHFFCQSLCIFMLCIVVY